MQFHGHNVIHDFNGEEIIGTFQRRLLKTNQQEFRIEKALRRKGDKLYVKSKGYDSLFNSWVSKKDLIYYHMKMSQYFPKPSEPFGGDIHVKVDLSNYATKIFQCWLIRQVLH